MNTGAFSIFSKHPLLFHPAVAGFRFYVNLGTRIHIRAYKDVRPLAFH